MKIKRQLQYNYNSVDDSYNLRGQIKDIVTKVFTQKGGANARLTVERVNLPWGFFGSDGWERVNLTDYQGNIRAVARNSYIIDHIDYYPYGLPKASAPGSVSRYKYSSKEFESRHGLDLYDYHARLQLPTAGLFSRPDPKAWDAPWNNTYLYCSANPVNRIDPDGTTDFFNSELGKTTYIDDGINRVIELSADDFLELEANGFDTSYDRYEEICNNGTDRSDVLPTIMDVLKDSEFVKYVKGSNCKENAYIQNNTEPQGVEARIDTFNGSPKNLDEGISYINSQLTAGKSVVVGVGYGYNKSDKNHNPSTQHFINIVGQGFELKYGEPVNYISFYDNGTSSSVNGRNTELNRLSQTNGVYSGTNTHVKGVNMYILTEIRRNK